MTSISRVLIVSIAAMAPALAAPAQTLSPYGLWRRAESGTTFDFYNCAEKLCAKVISVAKPEEKNAIGTVILRNAVQNDEGDWEGALYNTRDGKTYNGTISVKKPTELTLTGCLISFLCKSEKWERAKDQSAASTPNGQPAMPAPSLKPGLGH
ncbi:MAG: DUF2147 domain-containing protein [Hyphomicrobiales bacterium]|nr:DUF2147 domain-containing protein [Hyphomicrobiales bacterium]